MSDLQAHKTRAFSGAGLMRTLRLFRPQQDSQFVQMWRN